MPNPDRKLGRNPSDPYRVTIPFHRVVDVSKIAVPDNFGHYGQVKEWGMLGNDKYGDCAWASGAHESILQNAANNRVVAYSDASVLSDYSAATGFSPGLPYSDQGTDLHALYQYRQQVGLLDAAGNRHKIGAYLELEPGNPEELEVAVFLFGAAGLGITVYDWTQQQFGAGKPWDYVRGGNLEGGHAVPVAGRNSGFWEIVTWGQVQPATNKFFQKETTEVFVAITDDYLSGDKSPEGFDREALLNYLQDLPKL
jgi:hypothetical protein